MDSQIEQIDNSDTSKNWLQRLKDESWEAELLISTVAIFGTVQLFKLLSWMIDWFINILAPSQYLLGYVVSFMGLLAISILTTMFVIHFLLRAYWVGLVGLNSVFPDYGLEDSAYSKVYTHKMLSILPKLKDTIAKVDDLCSVIFSAAFFLFFMYGYFSIVSLILLMLYINYGEMVPDAMYTFLKWAFIFLIALQMIFSIIANLKQFKQNEKLQISYFYFVKWSSVLLMGPLYKYIMQISMSFGSNFKKQKSLIGLIVVFLIIGFTITMTQFRNSKMPYLINADTMYNESKLNNQFYQSSAGSGNFLLGPQIEAEVIKAPVMKLFIPVYKYESKYVDQEYGKVESKKELPKKERNSDIRKRYLERSTNYHAIEIDGVEVPFTLKRFTQAESKQHGLISFLNIGGLEKGEHTLTIRKVLEEEGKEWSFPFYYYPQN